MAIIGTAGHIDHGKSALIRALTSIDPDRLPEEKRREMTIDLGFAWLRTSSGEVIGIVDVPGHEDFVRNMVAGTWGIDAALLVIAADEGWMPQTEEEVRSQAKPKSMVKAGNMKLTFENRTGIILNVSGGGCPDIPYLSVSLIGRKLAEAPRPKENGFTLCAMMLDRAFVECLELWGKRSKLR